MNSKNINKDTDQSPPEGRHSMRRATDDLGAQSFPLKPQYAILVEAGWPQHRPAMPVGLRKRRQEPTETRQRTTKSFMNPNWEQLQRWEQWCADHNVTQQSAFDLMVAEFLVMHDG